MYNDICEVLKLHLLLGGRARCTDKKENVEYVSYTTHSLLVGRDNVIHTGGTEVLFAHGTRLTIHATRGLAATNKAFLQTTLYTCCRWRRQCVCVRRVLPATANSHFFYRGGRTTVKNRETNACQTVRMAWKRYSRQQSNRKRWQEGLSCTLAQQ